MTKDVPSPPQRTLDRDAVERVLQRATALQAQAGGDRPALLDEAGVYEAAAELGLAPALVRQALIEERVASRTAPETGLRVRLGGPGTAVASRTIAGDGPTTLRALEHWMHHDECLAPRRRQTDEVVWEARRDLASRLRRAVPFDGRPYLLARARSVVATVADDGHGHVCVRLTADLSNERLGKLTTGGAIAGAGALAGAIGGLAGLPIPADVLIAATGAGTGAIVARSHVRFAGSAVDALERILDRVESREQARPSVLGTVVSRGVATGVEHLRRAHGDLAAGHGRRHGGADSA